MSTDCIIVLVRSHSLLFTFFSTSGAVEHTALCFLFFPFTSFYRTNILHSLPHWNGVLAKNFLSAFTIRMQTATNMDIIYAYCNMNTKTPMHRCICRSVCLCANVRPSMNCLRSNFCAFSSGCTYFTLEIINILSSNRLCKI